MQKRLAGSGLGLAAVAALVVALPSFASANENEPSHSPTATAEPHELGDREIDMEAWRELTRGRVAGEPRSCVSALRSNRVRVVERLGMVYEQGDTVWIALARHPHRLDDFDIPVIRRTGSQLCKFDQITLLDRSTRFFSGVLFLDDFVPYTRSEGAGG